MAFASFDAKSSAAPVAEINMVPLIDVMLVLLVIFIVTAPLLTHSVKLDLPKVTSQANYLKPEKLDISITAAGDLYYNGEPLSRSEIQRRFKDASQLQPQPEIHLRADRMVPYHFVAETLADASNMGLAKVGFVSEPTKQ